jgi:hypothetical protein
MNYILFVVTGMLLLTGAFYWGYSAREEVVSQTEQAGEPTPTVEPTAPEVPEVVAPPKTTPQQSGNAIDLRGQGLTRVPEYVFSRTDITSLDVSNNKLTGALQAEVRKLANLRTLDLSDNTFTGVPAEVGQLSKLEVLDLSNNPITGLPYEIGNLRNLKTLDLRGTQYSAQDLEVIRTSLPSNTVILTD